MNMKKMKWVPKSAYARLDKFRQAEVPSSFLPSHNHVLFFKVKYKYKIED